MTTLAQLNASQLAPFQVGCAALKNVAPDVEYEYAGIKPEGTLTGEVHLKFETREAAAMALQRCAGCQIAEQGFCKSGVRWYDGRVLEIERTFSAPTNSAT